MSNPNYNKDLFEFLTKIYKSSVKKSLEIPKDEISESIEKILDDNASSYGLSTNSAINSVQYYGIKSRVKSEESFSEKLIRKDIGLEITNKYGKSIKELKKARVNIINDIKKLDDIVGIRIVTELKEDCNNIYKILIDNLPLLQESEIELHDLEDQPQTMKNGLDIFRIKGTYQDHVCFELQIKSKIDEAWGEMDHTIFYKDHTISPIKDTVQLTMNNVGHLLEKIETLLFDLRESTNKFEANDFYNKFQSKVSEELSGKLKEIFGASIDLKEYTKSLFFMKNKIIKNKNVKNYETSFEHLNYEVTNPNLLHFVAARNKSHRITITESIFYNFLRTKSPLLTIDTNNYNENLAIFHENYKEFLFSDLSDKQQLDELLETNKQFISDPYLYTDPKKLKQFEKVRQHLVNTLEEDESALKTVLDLFFIYHYSGDVQLYLDPIIEELEFNISEKILEVGKATKDIGDSNEKKEWAKNTQHLLKVIQNLNSAK